MLLTEKQVKLYNQLASKGKSKRLRKKAVRKLDNHNFIKSIELTCELIYNLFNN